MGINASIYKDKGKSFSICGISASHDAVCIVNAEGPFEPNESHPPVLLIVGPFYSGYSGRRSWQNIIAVPAELDATGRWVEMKSRGCRMCGGTMISTSDSRFGEAVARLGGHRFAASINLHDRFEVG